MDADALVNRSFENKKVVSIFLLRDDGALLLQHRDNKPGLPNAGRWSPLGGHCEADEDVEACVRRELREETGYDCKKLNLLGSFTDASAEKNPAPLLNAFWVLYDGVQMLRCMEGQAIKFVKRDEARSYEVPQYLVGIWDRAIRALRQYEEKG